MIFKNVSPEAVDYCAKQLGMVAYRQSGDARRAVLRPTERTEQRRVSVSYYRLGGRVNAVCWHGHRDFFRLLFKTAPEARVETRLGLGGRVVRYTADNFEDSFEDTGYVNIGSIVQPVTMAEACSCPEGAF